MEAVFNNFKRVWDCSTKLNRGIVNLMLINNKVYIELGYFNHTLDNVSVYYEGIQYCAMNYKVIEEFFVWSNVYACYVFKGSKDDIFNKRIKINQPYRSYKKSYSAEAFKDEFKDKQVVENEVLYKYTDLLKYTFGIEYETSEGAIPQHLLIESGLIPLRDGSITGCEYATVVMGGNFGVNLINKQLDLLNTYCGFNRNCALHFHFGGFPLNEKFLLKLNNLFSKVNIDPYVPKWTWTTEMYKDNGKSYNKKPRTHYLFTSMYEAYVGRKYFGDLNQPHPNDLTHQQKWNVHTRYMALNLINALCYKSPKTVEFRFLRPTFNKKKILAWLFILNAYLLYAESKEKITNDINVILDKIYPNELALLLKNYLSLQAEVIETQTRNGDYIGETVEMENVLLKEFDISKLIVN